MMTTAQETPPSEQILTEVQAATILRRYQELWNKAALTELLNGFSDDIVVEFADLPRIKGKAELERILRARLARQKGYRLEKTLRAVTGPTIIGTWVADWIDGTTGRPMKGKGIEILEMRDGKCARWEATFNAWDAEGPRNSLFT
jgi:ketosteroid isomerase-like protein